MSISDHDYDPATPGPTDQLIHALHLRLKALESKSEPKHSEPTEDGKHSPTLRPRKS